MSLQRGVASILKMQIQPVKLFSKEPFMEDARGDLIDTFAAPKDLLWPTTSISSRQLMIDGSGKYTTEDRNFYQIGSSTPVNEGDEFEYNTIRYTVKDIKDNLAAGGFIRYLCKKSQPQPDKRSL